MYRYNYKKFKKNSPLIIFIHGAGCDLTFWSLLNRYYYFKEFSTLAINLPGHGGNNEDGLKSIQDMAVYVQNIVKKYSVKENILIGHSMGSLICLSVLEKELFKVSKAILIGIAFPMIVSDMLLALSKKNSQDAIIKMINWSLPNKAKLSGSHLIGLNLPNFVNAIMRKTVDTNLYHDLNACNKYLVTEETIKNINTSCLIIAGKQDIMTPLKSGYKLNKLLKNSSIEF